MKIPVPLAVLAGFSPQTVEGEIVDVAPHLAMVSTYIVHKSPWLGGWQVSDVEGGYRIGRPSHRTKDAAVKAASILLKSKTQADILAAYKRWGVK